LRDDLRGVLESGPSSRLILELTEHTRIEDYGPVLAGMELHRREGVRIAVDDTGAGYAGLQHILRLRPDVIKLDLDLTRGIHLDPARRALAVSLKTFADELGAVVVAEGIEVREELETLQALGVPWGQGFHLGRPALVP
jgi:EAL domain-containing protein (putative c-di-GMP-specific phosphodiesterase class I)